MPFTSALRSRVLAPVDHGPRRDDLVRQARGARQAGRIVEAQALEDEIRGVNAEIERQVEEQEAAAAEQERREIAMKYGQDPLAGVVIKRPTGRYGGLEPAPELQRRDYFPAAPPGPSAMAIGDPAGLAEAERLGIRTGAPANPRTPLSAPASDEGFEDAAGADATGMTRVAGWARVPQLAGGRMMISDEGFGEGAEAPEDPYARFEPQNDREAAAADFAELGVADEANKILRDMGTDWKPEERGRLRRRAEEAKRYARAEAVKKERLRYRPVDLEKERAKQEEKAGKREETRLKSLGEARLGQLTERQRANDADLAEAQKRISEELKGLRSQLQVLVPPPSAEEAETQVQRRKQALEAELGLPGLLEERKRLREARQRHYAEEETRALTSGLTPEEREDLEEAARQLLESGAAATREAAIRELLENAG